MSDLWRDLAGMGSAEWDEWHAGYCVGYRHGVERGREHERDEVSALQRAAAAVVHRMADLEPRDQGADLERAEIRASWWRRRRGDEVAS